MKLDYNEHSVITKNWFKRTHGYNKHSAITNTRLQQTLDYNEHIFLVKLVILFYEFIQLLQTPVLTNKIGCSL
jgi:hypothetical protein